MTTTRKKIQVRLSSLKIHDGVRGDIFERLISGDDHRHGRGIPDYINKGIIYEVKQASGDLGDIDKANYIIYCPWLPYTVTGYNIILRVQDFVGLHKAYVVPVADFKAAMDAAGAIRLKSSSAAYSRAKALGADHPEKDTVCIQTVINWSKNAPYGEPHGKLLERILNALDECPTAIDFRDWWKKEHEGA